MPFQSPFFEIGELNPRPRNCTSQFGSKIWDFSLILRIGFNCSVDEIRVLLQQKMGDIFGYTAYRQLSQLFAAVVFFHSSEYLLAVTIHGKFNVPLSSLLISKPYVLAMACSLLEYVLEIILFPGLKEQWWISNVGLVLVLIGEIIRKTAVLTAGRAFTHNIRVYHEDHHELVTRGIYKFIRHPGYCGFFIWATSTQIMLCNPFCTVAFTAVTWRFFSTRIPYEEFFLRQFFGSQYVEYAERVPSGVPFIK
ncbi:protein-S-isoprenylcysteine O-methyltransferase A-like isoform X2 [Tasmannia lanceolata]|uniref:protein-S-isoprenylcysteine O-methyltransferase A-like isoform X2 n=1 Tax=Tasmannia lanceolata TaxID=3420 RepID=UPI0040628828